MVKKSVNKNPKNRQKAVNICKQKTTNPLKYIDIL